MVVTCVGCDCDIRWLKKAMGAKKSFKEGVQDPWAAGAKREESNLRPFDGVGTQGLTRLSTRDLIRLAHGEEGVQGVQGRKREELLHKSALLLWSRQRVA